MDVRVGTDDGGTVHVAGGHLAGGAGLPSARSVLLTVLGEFVLPGRRPVWTATLVRAHAELGIEEKAARQALLRTAADGIISAERDGRRARWTLSPAGLRLLRDGAERIYGFASEAPRWQGRWLVLAVTVPESQRHLRHRLRTGLTWAGLGSPSPGLWVTPNPEKEAEARGVIEDLGLAGAVSFVGAYGSVGSVRRMVDQAWDLDELQRRYAAFVERFSAARVRTDEEAFRHQVHLVQQWRLFPFLDPGLPASLLPVPWAGTRAVRLFRRLHPAWHQRAQRHWAALTNAAGVPGATRSGATRSAGARLARTRP